MTGSNRSYGVVDRMMPLDDRRIQYRESFASISRVYQTRQKPRASEKENSRIRRKCSPVLFGSQVDALSLEWAGASRNTAKTSAASSRPAFVKSRTATAKLRLSCAVSLECRRSLIVRHAWDSR
jgi:hypothetical protein